MYNIYLCRTCNMVYTGVLALCTVVGSIDENESDDYGDDDDVDVETDKR